MTSIDIDALIADVVKRPERAASLNVHVSDLGRCKRQVALRISGAPKEPDSPARQKMLWLADSLHELVYLALEKAGVLIAKEVEVEQLPDGMSGRLDYIRTDNGRFIVGDVKTTHPNRVRYDTSLPDERAVLQVSAYAHYMGIDGREVIYVDRGGENPSIVCSIASDVNIESVVNEYLAVREAVLSGGELPDPLPLEYSWIYRNTKGGGQLGIGPNWECRYCRYECPNRRIERRLLARIAPSYGYRWTALGRKYLREDPHGLSEFLFGGKGYADSLLRTYDSFLEDDEITPGGDESCAKEAPIPR